MPYNILGAIRGAAFLLTSGTLASFAVSMAWAGEGTRDAEAVPTPVAVGDVVKLKEDVLGMEVELQMLARDRAAGEPRLVDVYVVVDDDLFQIENASISVSGGPSVTHAYSASEAHALAQRGAHRVLRAELPAGTHAIEARFDGRLLSSPNRMAAQRGRMTTQVQVNGSDMQVVLPIRRSGPGAPAALERPRDARLDGVRYLLHQNRYMESLLELAESGAYPVAAEGAHPDQGWLLAEAFIGFDMLERAQGALDALDAGQRPDTWRRLHLFLARNHVQREQWSEALAALDVIDGQLDDATRNDWHELRVQALLGEGRFEDVVNEVHGLDTPTAFMRLNKGIALLELGEEDWGEDVLEELVARPIRDLDAGTALTLRDRARLKLANHYLEQRRDREARRILANVGEGRAYSSLARLTRGWAEYAPADDERASDDVAIRSVKRAMREWEPLMDGPLTDLAVQEVMLAAPFVYERIGREELAIPLYEAATEKLEITLQDMERSREAIKSGLMVEAIMRAEVDQEGGLSWELTNLPDVDELDWLLGYLASPHFQEPFKTLRDLRLVQQTALERAREFTASLTTEQRRRYQELTRSLRTPGARISQARIGDGEHAERIPRIETLRVRAFELANQQADYIESLTLAELESMITATERRLVESRLALARVFEARED